MQRSVGLETPPQERAWIDEWSGRGRSEGWCTSAVRPVVRAAGWQMLFLAAGGVTALPAAPRRWCDTPRKAGNRPEGS